jgi:hypothetical protein
VLHLAPTPQQGRLVRRSSLTAALRRAARSRGIPAAVISIPRCTATSCARRPRSKRRWFECATALLHALATAVAKVARLEQALTAAFAQHPDAPIITSFPGIVLAPLTPHSWISVSWSVQAVNAGSFVADRTLPAERRA